MTIPDTRSWPETRLDLPYPDPHKRWTGSRYDYPFGGDDGYDWMGSANPKLGYKEIASWGADGWDLGNWPYVIISISLVPTEGGAQMRSTVLTYVEGDLTFEQFDSRDEAKARIDSAFLYWAEDHVIVELVKEAGKLPTTLAEVPERFRGPYRRRA